MAQAGSDMLPIEFLSVGKTLGITALKFWDHILVIARIHGAFLFFHKLLAD